MSQLQLVNSLQPRVLVVEDDDLVAEAIGVALAASGHDVTLCSDAVCAAVLLEENHFDSVVADMHLRGSFTFDGLHVAARCRAVNPDASVVMVTGFASDDAVQAARAHGAQVLAKPFDMETLEQHVATGSSRDGRIARMPSFEETVSDHLETPHFQPIVRFTPSGVSSVAAEALTRLDARLPLHTPDALFRYAAARDAIADLDIECLRRIFDRVSVVDPGTLFVNIHPRSLLESTFADRMLGLVRSAGLDPARIVVEITEHDSLPHTASVARALATLRGVGMRFALDDIGIAHSHLELIDCIRPAFMKISFDIGARNRLATRKTLIRNLTVMAHELGCDVVAERIETAEEESMARELEIDFAQGYRFGRPASADSWLEVGVN
jgi:EAL domain-containing protein (putative c-di-GMP-specific phosphodiesterase class I)